MTRLPEQFNQLVAYILDDDPMPNAYGRNIEVEQKNDENRYVMMILFMVLVIVNDVFLKE